MSAPIEEIVTLAVFARVVECKSFTNAATMLGLSKSVVSSKVAQLERKMGVRLTFPVGLSLQIAKLIEGFNIWR